MRMVKKINKVKMVKDNNKIIRKIKSKPYKECAEQIGYIDSILTKLPISIFGAMIMKKYWIPYQVLKNMISCLEIRLI
jgi:hypothetical protein